MIYRTLTLLALGWAALTAQAEAVWHLVADGNEKVPVSEVEYLLSVSSTRTVDVVLKGSAAIENVACITFEMAEAGLRTPESTVETILGPYDDCISISRLAPGKQISVYNAQGALIATYSGINGSLTIDISAYAPGVYILRTPNSSVKFIKR